MAHLYGTTTGSASTTATRCGTRSSGIDSTARGWDIGGSASVFDSKTHGDTAVLQLDGGSNDHGTVLRVDAFRDEDGSYIIDIDCIQPKKISALRLDGRLLEEWPNPKERINA